MQTNTVADLEKVRASRVSKLIAVCAQLKIRLLADVEECKRYLSICPATAVRWCREGRPYDPSSPNEVDESNGVDMSFPWRRGDEHMQCKACNGRWTIHQLPFSQPTCFIPCGGNWMCLVCIFESIEKNAPDCWKFLGMPYSSKEQMPDTSVPFIQYRGQPVVGMSQTHRRVFCDFLRDCGFKVPAAYVILSCFRQPCDCTFAYVQLRCTGNAMWQA